MNLHEIKKNELEELAEWLHERREIAWQWRYNHTNGRIEYNSGDGWNGRHLSEEDINYFQAKKRIKR